MSLEGLEYILNKREVVPTVSARDLLERAEQVDADYKRHVRTYVPISRVSEGREGQLNVEEFEKRVIKQVKEARAPRGYLTADYGYGKTSTALYLWQRAEDANLVAAPPFQMLELPDLVTATHGWVRYRLQHRRPDLIALLEALYTNTIERSIEKEAHKENISIAKIREWVAQGRFIPDLLPSDYISYFEDVTEIVLQAGFEGLLILPDEIQQYIEPKITSKAGDPIAPFFNLVQGLATRTGYLSFGFIMVIPLKEIGVIREARGRDDLLHRMRELSLDLSSVYDSGFAIRLWERLAEEFNFVNISKEIVSPETLRALGEIAVRDDISNGPRTVINVFRRMVERYRRGKPTGYIAYSPVELIEDFMDEQAIQFSGDNKIRNVTRRAMQSAIVRSNPHRYEPAIKLAAAFPTEGIPLYLQKQYGVETALNELMQAALGDLVIAVGPVNDNGITLSGLDRGQVQVKWLPQTIRDFRRAYGETHDNAQRRAIEVFCTLLKTQIFKGWKVLEEYASTFTSNHSIILEGDYPSFAANFPRRRIHVRILWEDEERKDATIRGDIVIEYHLSIHRDKNREDRRSLTTSIKLDTSQHTAIIPLNLVYLRPDGIPAQIQQQLQGVWSPYDLSPFVLMNIYQMLEEKRADNLIPRQDDQFIKNGFQPDLLDNILRNLFNAEVGASLGAAGIGITEQAVVRLLDARYGNSYRTLIAVTTWRDSLRKYTAALERLENRYQRRGDIEVEGNKKQIADLMVLTATALDNFLRTFDTLLVLTRDWPTRGQTDDAGAVRFTLHPLEERIMGWLRESKRIERITNNSNSTREIHSLNVSDVYTWSRKLGYQDEEIEALLNLLVKRELIEFYQNHLIREVPSQAPDLDSLGTQLHVFEHEVSVLLNGFSGNPSLLKLQDDIQKWRVALEKELSSGKPDPQRAYRLGMNVKIRYSDLRLFASEKQSELTKQTSILIKGMRPLRPDQITSLNDPINGSVVYVDQVNVLRQALRKHTDNVKTAVEQLHGQLEQARTQLNNSELSYETLAQLALDATACEKKLTQVNNQVEEFENNYRHLSAWRRLVANGSTLADDIQQMDLNMVRSQSEEFDRFMRNIREDISSKAASAKLDALPNYTIFENRLAELVDQVRKIRNSAQDTFTDLQNRYRQLLIGQGLFRREQLDRPVEYNFSNPRESIRRLHEDIQRQMLELSKQIANKIKNYKQGILIIVNSNQIKTLPLEESRSIEDAANDLIGNCEDTNTLLMSAESLSYDIGVIGDFPATNQGKFSELVTSFIAIRDQLRDIDTTSNQLRNKLAEAELTAQEQLAFEQLFADDIEHGEDVIEWKRRVQISDDEFWQAIRGLYEKHRIRQVVSRIRR